MSRTQKFNVLLVTKKCNAETKWHTPIYGPAEVFTVSSKELGVRIVKTMVRFQGMERELLYVRSGLSGTAVTLAIDCPDDPFKVWELYTDTPTEGNTSDTVLKIARRTLFG